MSFLIDKYEPLATDVSCTEDALRVVLADAREVAVPFAWFPYDCRRPPRSKGKIGVLLAVELAFIGNQ